MFLLMLLVLPILELNLLIPDRFSSKQTRLVVIGASWLFSLNGFWMMGSFAGATSSKTISILEQLMSRLGFWGTVLVSASSGFAAANVIFEHFLQITVTNTAESVREKELTLTKLYESIASLKEAINRARSDDEPKGFFGGLVNRLTSSHMDKLVMELAEEEEHAARLRRELDGLVMMGSQKQSASSRALATSFAWYCLARMPLALYGSLVSSAGTVDPITTLMAIIAKVIQIEFNYALWSQLISLVLAGAIITSSFKAFMPILFNVLEMFAEINLTEFGILLLAQTMGVYILATLLMLKLTLPPAYRIVITRLMPNINLSFFGQWFERVYLITAIASALWLYMFGQKTR